MSLDFDNVALDYPAAAGEGSAMAIFSGITLALFALCFFILSKSFLHIAIRTRSDVEIQAIKNTGSISIRKYPSIFGIENSSFFLSFIIVSS